MGIRLDCAGGGRKRQRLLLDRHALLAAPPEHLLTQPVELLLERLHAATLCVDLFVQHVFALARLIQIAVQRHDQLVCALQILRKSPCRFLRRHVLTHHHNDNAVVYSTAVGGDEDSSTKKRRNAQKIFSRLALILPALAHRRRVDPLEHHHQFPRTDLPALRHPERAFLQAFVQ